MTRQPRTDPRMGGPASSGDSARAAASSAGALPVDTVRALFSARAGVLGWPIFFTLAGLAALAPFAPKLAFLGCICAAIAFCIPLAPLRPEPYFVALVVISCLNLPDLLTTKYNVALISKLLILAIIMTHVWKLWQTRSLPSFDTLPLLALVFYILVAALSTFWAVNPVATIEAVDSLVRDVLVGLLVLAVVDTFRFSMILGLSFLVSLSFLAALGTFTFSIGDPWLNLGGFTGAMYAHIEGEVEAARLIGPYDDPNPYARILLLGLPLAIYQFSYSRNHMVRWGCLAALICLVMAIFYTYSRGALLGAAAMLAVCLVRYPKLFVRIGLLSFPFLLIAPAIIPDEMTNRIASSLALFTGDSIGGAEVDESTVFRKHEMLIGLQMFYDHPLFGAGYNNYRELFQKYALDHHYILRFENRAAHSLILQILAEQGLLGLLAFLGVCATCIYSAFQVSQRLRDRYRQESDYAFALGVCIAGYLTASLVLHESYSRTLWILAGLVLALPACARSLEKTAEAHAAGLPLEQARAQPLPESLALREIG